MGRFSFTSETLLSMATRSSVKIFKLRNDGCIASFFNLLSFVMRSIFRQYLRFSMVLPKTLLLSSFKKFFLQSLAASCLFIVLNLIYFSNQGSCRNDKTRWIFFSVIPVELERGGVFYSRNNDRGGLLIELGKPWR